MTAVERMMPCKITKSYFAHKSIPDDTAHSVIVMDPNMHPIFITVTNS